MIRTITALTLIGALGGAVVASPALAAEKRILPTGGTSRGSMAPSDNMADQLNGQSLTATQSGGAYQPAATGAMPAGDSDMPMHRGKHMRHRRGMHHMGGQSMSDAPAGPPGMTNNPASPQ